ncbi:MAG: peptidoglycan-binding protein [Granulosicoccus sp.]
MKRKPDNQPVWPTASTEDVMMVQETMKVMGLYDGAVDGLPGTATFRAVRAYKKSVHLAPDNHLDAEFINHLRNET